MRCAIRTLVICLAAMLPAILHAGTLELRIFSVTTGLDLGDGAGRPASDYYIDGGEADGMATGMRLSVHRLLRIDDPVRNRTHDVLQHVGELEVLSVFEDSSVARVTRIESPHESPLFEPHAMMIGDYVLHSMSEVSRKTSIPPEDSGGAEATPLEAHSDKPSSLTSEAPIPDFPSANRWYPLPPPVFFELASSHLDEAARHGLEGVALVLAGSPQHLIALEGRTCDLGTPQYNHALSLRRARTVAAFLQSRGVASDRVSVSAFGEGSPIAPNTNESTRRQNRRVDLRLGTIGPTEEPEIPTTNP